MTTPAIEAPQANKAAMANWPPNLADLESPRLRLLEYLVQSSNNPTTAIPMRANTASSPPSLEWLELDGEPARGSHHPDVGHEVADDGGRDEDHSPHRGCALFVPVHPGDLLLDELADLAASEVTDGIRRAEDRDQEAHGGGDEKRDHGDMLPEPRSESGDLAIRSRVSPSHDLVVEGQDPLPDLLTGLVALAQNQHHVAR